MPKYVPLVVLMLGGLILTLGDVFAKEWVRGAGAKWAVLAMAVYMVGMGALMWSFKYKNIAVASVLFVLFNALTLTLLSWWRYKEPLSMPQLAGMAIALAGVIVLELSEA